MWPIRVTAAPVSSRALRFFDCDSRHNLFFNFLMLFVISSCFKWFGIFLDQLIGFELVGMFDWVVGKERGWDYMVMTAVRAR